MSHYLVIAALILRNAQPFNSAQNFDHLDILQVEFGPKLAEL
jgi:hypothetical protein